MIQKIFQLRVCDDTVLKIEKDRAFYIKLKDVLDLVLDTLKKNDYKKLLMMLLSLFLENQEKFKKVLSDQMEKASDESRF